MFDFQNIRVVESVRVPSPAEAAELRAQLRAARLMRDLLAVMLDEVRQQLQAERRLCDALAADLERWMGAGAADTAPTPQAGEGGKPDAIVYPLAGSVKGDSEAAA
jgi:hypothetical protein